MNMPSIFKALASITVWILFVYGCLAVLGGLVLCAMSVSGAKVNDISALVHPCVGVASLILSVVAAWFRIKYML